MLFHSEKYEWFLKPVFAYSNSFVCSVQPSVTLNDVIFLISFGNKSRQQANNSFFVLYA